MKVTLKDGTEHNVDSVVAKALFNAGATQEAAYAFKFPSNPAHNAAVEEAINMKLPLAWLIGQRCPNLKRGSTVEIYTNRVPTTELRYRGEVANISLEPALGEDVKNVVLVNLRKHE